MTGMPPSRYKVVERDRRLVVIDMRTGQPATRETPVRASGTPTPAAAPSARPVIEATGPRGVDDRSGQQVITTSRLYDLNGPRRIVLDETMQRGIGRWVTGWVFAGIVLVTLAMTMPWLWIVPLFLLFHPGSRNLARRSITARIDRALQEADASSR